MTRNNLPQLISNVLPSLSGSSLTYNAEKNILLTMGYTSNAGNTYYRGIRVSDRLIVDYELGQGYAYTFLNGIRLYCFDGSSVRLIGKRSFRCNCFSEEGAKGQCIQMLSDYLKGQLKISNAAISIEQIDEISSSMIQELRQKQLN